MNLSARTRVSVHTRPDIYVNIKKTFFQLLPSSYCTEFFFRLRLQEQSFNIIMCTIGEMLPDTHFLKEKIILEVNYTICCRHRKETITFPSEVKDYIENFIPYEFDTPMGIHLHGLLKHPITGSYHAFMNPDNLDKMMEIYKDKAQQIAEEEALDDGTEWRAPRSLRESRFKKYPNPSDDYVEKPVIYHNAIETNRRKH